MVHQDGYGTVDSEHTVLQGYNEVMMLRRLPENHKKNAVSLFPSLVEEGKTAHSVMYVLPHDNERKSNHEWANDGTIQEYIRMK